MKTPIFDAYSQYYDLLYRDKDYESEVAYLHALLIRNGLPLGSLLEFGSGTGKHGCLLAEMGYIVHGIERSAEMVAKVASAKGFTCQQGDITSANTGQKYDAVLSLFHVVSYLTSNAQLQNVFSNAAKHLNKGGLFIFDFWYSPAVYAQSPLVRVKRIKDERFQIVRLAEPVIYPNENRVDVNYTIFVKDLISGGLQTIAETHPMRHLSLPEIDLLALFHGFERIGAEEFLSCKQVSENTWGVCVILKKVV
jgi:SAM-dependent methyltransferase